MVQKTLIQKTNKQEPDTPSVSLLEGSISFITSTLLRDSPMDRVLPLGFRKETVEGFRTFYQCLPPYTTIRRLLSLGPTYEYSTY